MPTQSVCQQVIQLATQHPLCLHIWYHQQQHQLCLLTLSSSDDSSINTNSDDDSSSGSSSDNDSESNVASDFSCSTVSSLDSQDTLDQQLASLRHSYIAAYHCAIQFICLLLTTGCLFPHNVAKCSQLGLVLQCYKNNDPYCFWANLHISPNTFDPLLSLIQDHPIFHNNSSQEQTLIPHQLAIVLYWFGHFGSQALVTAIVQWAGCSEGIIVKAIWWPSLDEKQEASNWIEGASCSMWQPGFCMVDGMLIPLFLKPGHYGEQFFDWKSNYSLSLMVQSLILLSTLNNWISYSLSHFQISPSLSMYLAHQEVLMTQQHLKNHGHSRSQTNSSGMVSGDGQILPTLRQHGV